MDPGDDIVARVHRIGADRQFLDPEGVDEAGGVERLRPPLGSFLQRIADRLRRGAVDIEDDRLLDRRTLGIGIGLLLTSLGINLLLTSLAWSSFCC